MTDTGGDERGENTPPRTARARPPARGYEGPPRKMIESTAPTHAKLVEIGHEISSKLGRPVTIAEALERVVDAYETGRE